MNHKREKTQTQITEILREKNKNSSTFWSILEFFKLYFGLQKITSNKDLRLLRESKRELTRLQDWDGKQGQETKVRVLTFY